jgi:hypothetical protein
MDLPRSWLHVIAAVLFAWHSGSFAQSPTPPAAEAPLLGAWLVTVTGEEATRTLIISDMAPSDTGALLAAKYGMSSGTQSPIEAKMQRVGAARQLHLITQAGTVVAAMEQPGGTFTGTFALKSGVVKEVVISRLGDSAAHAKAADPTAFVPVAADVPPACAALHGTWRGTWTQGGVGETTFRVVEVASKDDICVLRIYYAAWQGSISVDFRGGAMSFMCNRTTGGTCSFRRVGQDLWATYSHPAGATNSAVFRKTISK